MSSLMHLELAHRAKVKDAQTKDSHVCDFTDSNDKCTYGSLDTGTSYGKIRYGQKCPFLRYGELQQQCNGYT
jgi:hypothetical protein